MLSPDLAVTLWDTLLPFTYITWFFINSDPVNVNVTYFCPSISSTLDVEFKYFLAISFPVWLSWFTVFFIVYSFPFLTVLSVVVSEDDVLPLVDDELPDVVPFVVPLVVPSVEEDDIFSIVDVSNPTV